MNAVRLNNVSLKYRRFTSSGCKDIRITKVEFVAKTQFKIFFAKEEVSVCDEISHMLKSMD